MSELVGDDDDDEDKYNGSCDDDETTGVLQLFVMDCLGNCGNCDDFMNE